MDIEGGLSRLSRNMYSVMDNIIGSEALIDMRRTTTNLRDDVDRICIESTRLDTRDWMPCYSGSRAEGLRFRSSDEDWMLIYKVIKVIPSHSFMAIYDSNTTLLLMENEMTKPGFTLLRLISDSTHQRVVSRSTKYFLQGFYLSCKLWRERHTALGLLSDEESTHGPCASGIHYTYEYDLAYCLRCDVWPCNAHDSIRRLHRCCWPSNDTILSIVKDGVLFVPIGAKRSIFENIEWRMSFSLAEKKLIHAMSHTQFLCYGLLKIFLKEAIDTNPRVKGLLCSYFLKTALFWEITTTSNQWNPSSLLSGFWNCFQRLLQWISSSYCPNFFIPQNNMFEGKIEGRNRDKLLQHLRTLYCKGYISLLRCSSLSSDMSNIITRPFLDLRPEEPSNSHIALEAANQWRHCLYVDEIALNGDDNIRGIKCLVLHRLIATTSNNSHISPLTYWLHKHLTSISMTMTNSNDISVDGRSNRSRYRNLTKRMNVLERCCTDCASHFLYQAMLCRSNGRYNHALRLIQRCKEKILATRAISLCAVRAEQFRDEDWDRLPTATMLRRHFLENITMESLEDGKYYIPELYIECHIHIARCGFIEFELPPLACAFFLQYFCLRKLGHLRKADRALHELSIFLQAGDTQQFCTHSPSISYNILGISKQSSGDDLAAYHFFLKALYSADMQDHYPLKEALCVRIGTILVKYF